jgi:hypothetical protein
MGVLILAGQSLTASLLNQYYGYSDANSTTVTQATLTGLSTSYTIPGGEPVIGSAYELACGGAGTWGSTQQPLTMSFGLNSNGIGLDRTIANTAFAASAVFRWAARFAVTCVSTGAGGTWIGALSGDLTETGSNINPGTAATNTVSWADAGNAATTVSTLAAIAVLLKAAWGSTTGAPTITNRWTTFRKVA